VLQVNDTAGMASTPNGSVIFACENEATQNNQGCLTLTSGGDPPVSIPVAALANQPTIRVHDWQANNLNVSNVSRNLSTPICIQAFGPGMPGPPPQELITGSTLSLTPEETAQGATGPSRNQLQLALSASALGVFGVIGGPLDASGNNAYVIAVNAAQTTGPAGPTPPPGYYATTTSNSYVLCFSWNGATVFVVYLGSATVGLLELEVPPATVTLVSL
jgi:hypothetical protein